MAENITEANSPTDIASGKPQATLSARVLRKREIDRKCQRMIRERTKSRIAYLENVVEHFRQSDPDERIQSLTQQLDETIAMRDSLMRKMHHIENIIAGNSQITGSEAKSSSQASLSPYDSPVTQHSSQVRGLSLSNKVPSLSSSPSPSNVSSTDQTRTSSFAQHPKEMFQGIDPAKFFTNHGDLPIRIMVEGWKSIGTLANVHPIWQSLKFIDEICSSIVRPHERLAILVNLSFGIEAHLNSVPQKDRFNIMPYLEQSIYDLLRMHGTRDTALPIEHRMSSYRYSCAIFWRSFCQNFQLPWQHEFRDCYVHDLQNGRYSISQTFHERLVNSRSWSIEEDFFEMYPELLKPLPIPNTNSERPKEDGSLTLGVHGNSQESSWTAAEGSNYSLAVRAYNPERTLDPAHYTYAPAPVSTSNDYRSYNFYTPLNTPVTDGHPPMQIESSYSPWPRHTMYQYSMV